MEILGLIELPWWLVLTLFIVATICLYTWYKQSLFKRLGIKQKNTMFLLGDLAEMKNKGFGYLDYSVYEKYGKVFGLYLGNAPTLVINDPEIIKQIAVKQFSTFTNRPLLLRLKEQWHSAISLAEDDTWRFLRHTLSPSFTSGKMRQMNPYLHRCLNIFHEILEENVAKHPNGFDVNPIIRGYTMDVILCTGFGLDASAQRDLDNPFVKLSKEFLELKVAGNPLFLFAIFFPDLVKLFPRLFAMKFVSDGTMTFFKETVMQIFKDRRNSSVTHKDLLQLMVNASKGKDKEKSEDPVPEHKSENRVMTETEMTINSIIFMMAAYETTATTLCWLLYDLALHTDVQEQLIEAIDNEIGEAKPSYDNVFTMQYLEMVVNETLRMHPPATRMNRVPCKDVEINGLKIPKGMDCTYTSLILHFLPDYWEEPMKYDPERFSPENKHKINEYAYIPFGVGPRNCIGMRLALLEVKMTLVSILQKYTIHRTDRLEVPISISKTGTNKPDSPVDVMLKPRK